MNYKKFINDGKNFSVKKVNDLVVEDIIFIGDNVVKILSSGIYRTGKISKMCVRCVGLFDDKIYHNILYFDLDIMIPCIEIKILEFDSITDKIIILFDEENNDIVELNINYSLDKKIIEQIKEKNNNNNNQEIFQVKIIKFLHWIRIIDIL